ncbi:dihydrodipicolinate reductase [Candidatus Bipolaricaulota bacterium]|nr:dihydrodipicolinate reductase [Candidatus Bipolaricaulota bacterium]MBS3814578.1 dihydrodipicolinate reductase [Candidatus Bipolaricaulota bacterium]
MGIKVVQYGLGKIGKEISKLVIGRSDFDLVGAIDIDAEMVGREIADVLELDHKLGIQVTDSPEKVLSDNPDIVFHSTASGVTEVAPQLREILNAGANIISTSEELAYPYLRHKELSEELHNLAAENEVTLLGTGVNPGFAMDLLPLTFSGVSRELKKVSVTRIQNASIRRKSLQEKIGVGLSEGEFDEKVREKGGHRGLLESVSLLATGLGWKLDEVKDKTSPVITNKPLETEFFKVSSGEISGIKQTARGLINGEEKITLNLQMYLEAADPVDEINLEGVPEISLKIPGGIHGDIATPAIAVNSSQKVLHEDPGLLTSLDLYPYLHNFTGDG